MQFRLTRAVKALLIANFLVFLVQHTSDQFLGGNFLGIFGLVPGLFMLEFHLWQILTYSFLHGDVMHLFINLLMLVFIGSELEGTWGTVLFLKFYFFCVVFGGLAYLFMQVFITKGLYIPMVGASGGIYGLLMAYGLLFGERVMLFMLLFPMKAKHFVLILIAVEFMTTVFSPRGGLSAIAHLGGMAGGFLYLWARAWWIIRSRNRPAKAKKKAKHLKLVINNDDDDQQSGPTYH